MFDQSASLRLKGEACRRLADLSDNAERKAVWLKRADEWDELARNAEKQLRARSRYKTCWSVETERRTSTSGQRRPLRQRV